MSKIVFFCIPAHGHTNPTLGVVKELVNRGHEVWYYSYDAFKEKIENAGAKFIACDIYDVEKNLKPEDRYVHKAFLNSENKEREVDAFYQDAYLHTNEQMIEKFKASDYDEAYVLQMFDNSMEIYDKVQNFSLSHTQQIPKVDVEDYPKKEFNHPEYPNLTSMFKSDDKIERYWVNKCIDKLKEIDKFNEIYLKELEEEADVKTIIGKKLDTNMFAYPVTLAHYIDLIWDCGSSVGVGRGSACSALNHYLLGITQLDPIEWNFPFFRYMNRVHRLAIDERVCQAAREVVFCGL